jgi:beta-carotene 3-hydroxylase
MVRALGQLAPFAAFAAGLAGMELVAWATHRYVMHGALWSWHRSHHAPRRGGLELNDLFGVVFAGLAVVVFAAGGALHAPLLTWLALGMTAYGLLYALVHDGLVHRRFPFPLQGRRGYLRRLVQAHHLHHAVHAREGAVSFGFLVAGDPARLAARLKAHRAA